MRNGPDPGSPGADDVDRRHVTHVPDLLGGESEEVDGGCEDPGVRLHHADIARVHDALDLHPDAGTHLAELEVGEALCHHTRRHWRRSRVGHPCRPGPAAPHGRSGRARPRDRRRRIRCRCGHGPPLSSPAVRRTPRRRSGGSRATPRTSSLRRRCRSRIEPQPGSARQSTPLVPPSTRLGRRLPGCDRGQEVRTRHPRRGAPRRAVCDEWPYRERTQAAPVPHRMRRSTRVAPTGRAAIVGPSAGTWSARSRPDDVA